MPFLVVLDVIRCVHMVIWSPTDNLVFSTANRRTSRLNQADIVTTLINSYCDTNLSWFKISLGNFEFKIDIGS